MEDSGSTTSEGSSGVHHLDGGDYDHNEILHDVEILSRQLSERKSVHERKLVVDDDFDLERLLSDFRSLADEQGIQLRSLGVSFQELSVFGRDQSYSYLPTVADLLKGPYALYQLARDARNSQDRAILDRFSGLVKSGEMLLVLGRPGSGCSTFLRTISGTERSMYTGISGTVNYDGLSQEEVIKRFASELIYNPELDVHFPHLTVKQTLDFALACKIPHTRVNGQSAQDHINLNRDILATVFGLRHTYNTKVGNDYVRGVSGGERKRVSIAEAMACEGSIYSWDNATRGLDASTALEYARAIRLTTNLLRKTALVTLYQAGENVYNTFDKVTVIYQGKQVYFGPVEDAKAYFETMGYECPPRQTTAEFLTAVTDPDGRKAYEGMENKVPKTASEFQEYWLRSPEYSNLQEEIEEYNKSHSETEKKEIILLSMKQQRGNSQRLLSRYVINFYQQIMLCCVRSFQNILNDRAYTIIQMSTTIIQALIGGSAFYNIPDSVTGAFSRSSVMYFATLFMSLNGMAEMTQTFTARPILMKQKNYLFYHPSAFALAESLCVVPISIPANLIFGIILYFLANLDRKADKFFIFILFQFLVSIAMNYLFKGIASWTKSIAQSNAVASVFILASVMYSSYMIRPASMHPWFKWVSYINPVKYGFEAMLTTEFHHRNMTCAQSNIVPYGEGYNLENAVCDFVGSVEGQLWVDGDRYMSMEYGYSFSHVWRNLGILFGFICFFLAVLALGYEVNRPVTGGIDRLFFLRGRSKTALTPEDMRSKDEESGPVPERDLKNRTLSDTTLPDLESSDTFVWKDITYVIPYDGSSRTLLDLVSGYCLPGLLTALMGESGAGKTTLLNTLSQRIDVGVVTGDMLVNGAPLDASFVRRTGYVQQQDIHAPEATVREALRFSARLRQPGSVPDAEKLSYVEKIIDILNMEEYADAIVGIPGSGLNVEQRKKLTIGTELVAKPSLLLFLDEPTSGLDSQSSWAIIQVLKDLAKAGQAILCTIHQPSATLFEEFERLLLLKKGGQTVYFGNIGHNSQDVVNYFVSHGGRPCEAHENPAEYILEAIGAGATAVSTKDWSDEWDNSKEKRMVMNEVERLISEGKGTGADSTVKELQSKYPTSAFNQLKLVTTRTALAFWRKPDYLFAKIAMMIVNGLFIGFSFYGLKHSLAGLQNGLFCAFMSTVMSYPLINQIQDQALEGREIYEGREKMCNTYSWWTMIVSQFLNEIPSTVLAALCMVVSVYFPTRAETNPAHAGVFILSYVVFLQFFNITFALMLAYFAPNIQSAALLVSFFYMFIFTFAGVIQPESQMPGFWTFMYKISPYTYVIQNSVSSMVHGRLVTCSAGELSFLTPPSGQSCQEYMADFLSLASGYLTNPNDYSKCGYCSYEVADQYIQTFGIRFAYVWRNMGFLCAFGVFNLCACMILYKWLRLTPVRLPLKKTK